MNKSQTEEYLIDLLCTDDFERRWNKIVYQLTRLALINGNGVVNKASEWLGVGRHFISRKIRDWPELKDEFDVKDRKGDPRRFVEDIDEEEEEDRLDEILQRNYEQRMKETEKKFWYRQLNDIEKEKTRLRIYKQYFGDGLE